MHLHRLKALMGENKFRKRISFQLCIHSILNIYKQQLELMCTKIEPSFDLQAKTRMSCQKKSNLNPNCQKEETIKLVNGSWRLEKSVEKHMQIPVT